jgi:membrane associated rhomboid family serine protease
MAPDMFPIKNAVPSRYPPVITWSLIAANCAIFLFEASLDPVELEQFLEDFALVPSRDLAPLFYDGWLGPALPNYLHLITNTFLHGGWLHLILNMWTLWMFGPAIEDRLGHGRYFFFYIGCGIAASLTHAAFNPSSDISALGASGAIAGVIGCFIRLFPLARLVVVIPILFLPLFFEIPAVIFAAFWFLLQILQGTADLLALNAGSGVAWWAHVGGFIVGFVLGPLLQQPIRRYRAYYPDEGILGFDPLGRR